MLLSLNSCQSGGAQVERDILSRGIACGAELRRFLRREGSDEERGGSPFNAARSSCGYILYTTSWVAVLEDNKWTRITKAKCRQFYNVASRWIGRRVWLNQLPREATCFFIRTPRSWCARGELGIILASTYTRPSWSQRERFSAAISAFHVIYVYIYLGRPFAIKIYCRLERAWGY